jgi:hypothetical protein
VVTCKICKGYWLLVRMGTKSWICIGIHKATGGQELAIILCTATFVFCTTTHVILSIELTSSFFHFTIALCSSKSCAKKARSLQVLVYTTSTKKKVNPALYHPSAAPCFCNWELQEMNTSGLIHSTSRLYVHKYCHTCIYITT